MPAPIRITVRSGFGSVPHQCSKSKLGNSSCANLDCAAAPRRPSQGQVAAGPSAPRQLAPRPSNGERRYSQPAEPRPAPRPGMGLEGGRQGGGPTAEQRCLLPTCLLHCVSCRAAYVYWCGSTTCVTVKRKCAVILDDVHSWHSCCCCCCCCLLSLFISNIKTGVICYADPRHLHTAMHKTLILRLYKPNRDVQLSMMSTSNTAAISLTQRLQQKTGQCWCLEAVVVVVVIESVQSVQGRWHRTLAKLG